MVLCVLIDQILYKYVLLECGDFDCFGRILATVYLTDPSGISLTEEVKKKSINQCLLDNNMAKNF